VRYLILPTLEKSEILHASMYLLPLKLGLCLELGLFDWFGLEEYFRNIFFKLFFSWTLFCFKCWTAQWLLPTAV